MKSPFLRITALLISLSPAVTVAQNLEDIGINKGIDLNGSINFNSVGYWSHGLEQRRDPLNWFVTGNLNVNIPGYSAPFSFSYSNTNRNFSQPFNQFSFAPTYKWVKTYVGYNSMTFSNYTLSGHVFLGGGVELTPKNWRIAAMYGRLRKAVSFNLNDTLQYTDASFKRMGYGLKVGYEKNGDVYSVNIFTAKDDYHSIPFVLPGKQLTPQQNIATSFLVRKRFLRRFFVESEYAVSSLNKDVRANNTEIDSLILKPTNNIIKGLLPENATNRYYDALNASIGYTGNWYMIQLKYERIAPEYESLGAYFFNNDMRNITIAPTVRLFENTLTLSANAGFQENNLDNARNSTTERFVGSANINYVPGEKWNFAVSHSNFSTYTNVKPQPDPFFQNTLDTLNFYQLSRTTNGTIIRNLGGKENPQSIMLNGSYQKASDKANYEGGSQQSDFISSNLSYNYSHTSSNTTVAVSGNMYSNNAAGMKSIFWGPSITLIKAYREKTVRVSMTTSYNETKGNDIRTSPVLNNRFNIGFTPKPTSDENGQHNLTAGLNVLSRLKSTEQQQAFTELTGTLNYTYSF